MDDLKKISEQRLEMLLEAMEMLADLRPHMAMFRNQHYCKLRKRVTLHTRQTEVMNTADHQISQNKN
ncbi:hypothetical protein ACFQZI_12690 [Mucilaginibacter lutimaris]|uniref:Uncharacterized protein n=1 Tax=Mucilaginibacter lutimaris TaxID=931629 RepID=A0ABW2ZHT1_9SPHI